MPMTTDRELLELAAKAADMVGMRYASPYMGMVKMIDPSRPLETGSIGPDWNPLTDDGDALRLAVKLNLHIGIDAESAGSITIEWDHDESGSARRYVDEPAPVGGDDYAATRRAIVRAAAEIGRAS